MPAPNGLSLPAAVRMAVAQQPQIRIQQADVVLARGSLREAAGQFDLAVQTSLSGGKTKTPAYEAADGGASLVVQDETDAGYQLSLSKQLRNGITLTPGLSLQQTLEHTAEDVPQTQSDIGLEVLVPLLQGFGRKAVAANERSAGALVQASESQLLHEVSLQVLNTILAYWGCVGALEALKINRAIEENAAHLVSVTRDLIFGAVVPELQLMQVRAYYEQTVAARIASEQTVVDAQQGLALALGLPPESLRDPPLPSQPLPPFAETFRLEGEDVAELVDLALAQRADLQGLHLEDRSKRFLVDAARNALLPRLDLSAGAGWAGVSQGTGVDHFVSALGDELTGVNVSGKLQFSFPVQNNQARGGLMIAQAEVVQVREQMYALATQIASSVVGDAHGLRNALAELRRREASRKYYQQTVAGYRELYQYGAVSLIDTITITEQLSAAQLEEISARVNCATTLVTVLFDTGALISSEGEGRYRIHLQKCLRVPQGGGRAFAAGRPAPTPTPVRQPVRWSPEVDVE